MAKKSNVLLISKISFWLAIIIALIAAIFTNFILNIYGTIAFLLLILGVIVGFLNIKANEASNFVLGVLVLIVINSLGSSITESLGFIKYLGPMLINFVNFLILFFVPAVVVVVLKSVLKILKP